MLRFVVGLIAVIAFIQVFAEEQSEADLEQLLQVNTDLGDVRGQRLTTLLHLKNYYAFRGIRYAKQPVGNLRFKPPQSPEPWTKPHDTLAYGNVCPQLTFQRNEFIGNEDCLFINVFTPDVAPSRLLPVIFAIHGGAYHAGSAEIFGPDFLLNENVVLVTFNYRLGPLGFLSLGSAEHSGNNGLKDQLLALRWVNRNIRNFGGDPSKITIYGQSAGASSVHLHLLSTQSKGLFRRAILSSGSALVPTAYNAIGNNIEAVKQLATSEGVSAQTESELVEFLNNIDVKILIEKTHVPLYKANSSIKELTVSWAPVVEVKGAHDPFLTRCPEKFFLDRELRDKLSSNVDTLFGFNSAESLDLVDQDLHHPEYLESLNQEFNVQLPLRYINHKNNSEDYPSIAKEIRQFYFGNRNISQSIQEFSELTSDAFISYGTHVAAREQATISSGKTFYYVFSAECKLNLFRNFVNASTLNIPGAAHIDELPYLFKIDYSGLVPAEVFTSVTIDSPEAKLIKRLTNIFANFATYGNPHPENEPVEWKPIENGVLNYLNITSDGFEPAVNPYEQRFTFWDNLYEKFTKTA